MNTKDIGKQQVYPDPAKIISVIDRKISDREEELDELLGSLGTNALTWSAEQDQSVYKKKLEIGYLREHGKTDALLDYANALLSELLPLSIKSKEQEISKKRRDISRQKTVQRNFIQAVDAAREIICEHPSLFRGAGKYMELARRVCRKLGWDESKIRTVRRELSAVDIIPDSD